VFFALSKQEQIIHVLRVKSEMSHLTLNVYAHYLVKVRNEE